LEWICTFAAVKAGVISPPAAVAAREERLGAGASATAAPRAIGIAVAAA
jgi:hypothetical protein